MGNLAINTKPDAKPAVSKPLSTEFVGETMSELEFQPSKLIFPAKTTTVTTGVNQNGDKIKDKFIQSSDGSTQHLTMLSDKGGNPFKEIQRATSNLSTETSITTFNNVARSDQTARVSRLYNTKHQLVRVSIDANETTNENGGEAVVIKRYNKTIYFGKLAQGEISTTESANTETMTNNFAFMNAVDEPIIKPIKPVAPEWLDAKLKEIDSFTGAK